MIVQNTRYVLAVPDLARSVSYYVDELGFGLAEEHPGWAFLNRGRFAVMLGECKNAIDPHKLGDHSYFAYVTVDNIDELFAEYAANDVTIRKALNSEPWGMREFAIETIDGHRIMFGQNI